MNSRETSDNFKFTFVELEHIFFILRSLRVLGILFTRFSSRSKYSIFSWAITYAKTMNFGFL